MDVENWEKEIRAAFRRQGKEYTQELRQLMFSTINTATKDQDKLRAVEVTNAMQRHFWRKVVKGETFGDVGRIRQVFGQSTEENYGLSAGPFIDLARAYWTYQIEARDLFPEYSDKWISQALWAVEVKVRELFFPTPGPVRVPAKMRRAAQEAYLKEFAPEVDIQRFLEENPILKANSKSGCLGAVTIIALFASGLTIYFYG